MTSKGQIKLHVNNTLFKFKLVECLLSSDSIVTKLGLAELT